VGRKTVQSKLTTHTFTADPAFIEAVRERVAPLSLSKFIVQALKDKLQRRSEDSDEIVRIPHSLGAKLVETLEFSGRWIVPPSQPIRHVSAEVAAPQATEAIKGWTDAVGPREAAQTTWWAAALTVSRSFIWLHTDRENGIADGHFSYRVQDAGDLAAAALLDVPQDVYETVRQSAGPLPPKRIG
jgi:hypothetical protein